jgi:integrase
MAEAWEEAQNGPHNAVGQSSAIQYLDVWRRHIRDFKPNPSRTSLGDREPAGISRQELYDCVHAAGSEARYVVNTLRSFWKFGLNRGIVTSDTTAGGFQLRSKRPEPKPLSLEHIDLIESHLAALEARGRRTDTTLLLDVWTFMRSSAARIGEALALKVRDIDWEAAVVHLAEQHVAKTLHEETGKVTDGIKAGGKTRASTRSVVIPARALDDLRMRCTDMTDDDPSRWKMRPAGSYVFQTDQGQFVTPSSYRSRLARELKKLDLGRTVTPHDLRDTAATAVCKSLIERYGLTAGLTEAARVLGHSGIGPALLSYVERSATIVDHRKVLEGLDPHIRKERARRAVVENLAGQWLGRVKTISANSVQLAVVAEHMSEAQEAARALDFTVVVTELDPDDVVF